MTFGNGPAGSTPPSLGSDPNEAAMACCVVRDTMQYTFTWKVDTFGTIPTGFQRTLCVDVDLEIKHTASEACEELPQSKCEDLLGDQTPKDGVMATDPSSLKTIVVQTYEKSCGPCELGNIGEYDKYSELICIPCNYEETYNFGPFKVCKKGSCSKGWEEALFNLGSVFNSITSEIKQMSCECGRDYQGTCIPCATRTPVSWSTLPTPFSFPNAGEFAIGTIIGTLIPPGVGTIIGTGKRLLSGQPIIPTRADITQNIFDGMAAASLKPMDLCAYSDGSDYSGSL
jgi:hypothetical protein